MAITLSYPDGCAFVVGGTGRVGRGIVRRLAQADVPVIFTYRSGEERAAALEAELRGEGLKVWKRQMDQSDLASIDAAIAFATQTVGRIHSVLSTGGPEVTFKKLADFSVEEVQDFLMADAIGYFRLINRMVPYFRANGGGAFVLCSTYALQRVIDYDGISPFSKGSVEALIRQIAAEEAVNGIRCNGVAIGWVDEDYESFLAQLPPKSDKPAETPMEMIADMMYRVKDSCRIQRPASWTEAGDVFIWLASNQSSYITGQVLRLDGGGGL